MSAESRERIDGIEAVPRDPNLRRIIVGRRTVGTVAAARIETLRLRVGAAWTARLAARVAHAEAVDAARRAALGILGRGGAASGALRARLCRRELPAKAVDEAVDELLADGWIDDEAFALGVAEAALRRGPLGPEALMARLVRRGVDEPLATRVAIKFTTTTANASGGGSAPARRMAGLRSQSRRNTLRHPNIADAPPDPVDHADAWARQVLRRSDGLSAARVARRIASGLTRRGLDEDTIASVLDRLGLNPADTAADTL